MYFIEVKKMEWNHDPRHDFYWCNCPILGECVIEKIDKNWHKTINGSYVGFCKGSPIESMRDFQAMKDKVVRAEIIQ